MKFIACAGFSALSSDLGDPNRVALTKPETAAYVSALMSQPAWIPSTADFQTMADSTPTDVGQLWNWGYSPFGTMRPDPLMGYILNFATSDLTRVIGQQVQVEYTWPYQVAGGYTSSSTPQTVTHKALFEFTKLTTGSAIIGLIPGQVTSGKTSLSLPRVAQGVAGNVVTVSGIPSGTLCRLRVLTRFDVDLLNLWPEMVEHVYGG